VAEDDTYLVSSHVSLLSGSQYSTLFSLTYSVSFAEMTCDHIVHVVILTQVELQQIDLHFTVLDKHAVFNHLDRKHKVKERD
jgi:hypothetical protein